MVKKITIEVKQEHIDKGKRCDSKSCPVALAMMDFGLKYVYVGDLYWGRGDSGDVSSKDIKLPGNATMFILNFDVGISVKPFSFELQISYYEYIKIWLQRLLK